MFEVEREGLDGGLQVSLSSVNLNVCCQPDILRQTSSQQNGIVISILQQLSSLGEESSNKTPGESGGRRLSVHIIA